MEATDERGRTPIRHVMALVGRGAAGGAAGGIGVLALAVGASAIQERNPGTLVLIVIPMVWLFAAVIGMVAGTLCGAIAGVVSLPWHDQPEVIRRHRGAWAVGMAGVAVLLLNLWAGWPSITPGPNETMNHVVEDWLIQIVGPMVAAMAVTWWSATSISRPATSAPAPTADR